MPSIKRSGVKAEEKKTGFESYDGPEPKKRGMYRARVTNIKFAHFKSGAQGFKINLSLEAAKGDPKDHAQFDGYPIITNIVFGDKEAMLTRESNLYAALGVKDDPTIVTKDEVGEKGTETEIKSIGGKSIEALRKAIVNADIKIGTYEGADRPEVDGIYVFREAVGGPKKTVEFVDESEEDEEDDDLLEDDEAEEEDEEQSIEERTEELMAASLAELKALATGDYDIDIKGMKKAQIVDAIVAYEFEEDGAAVLEDDEEEEDEDDEVEVDDEEDDEDSDDEEEEDDAEEERAAELADLDRNALKAIIKGHDPAFRVLKSHTEDDLREAIIDIEFGAGTTPF